MAADRKLVLGGVEIEHPLGLAGHSDADALTHAVIDALLGAVADGDIGSHFPDDDAEWKDADSLHLLDCVRIRLRELGVTRINHIDVSVIAEQPRLSPHVDAMRKNLARVLELPVDRISIKATTVEKMGAIGREEGIAATAVATVET